MNVRQISQHAILAALLFVIYSLGSQVPYIELLNFMILLYGVTLPRKSSFISVFIFTMLVMLLYGLQTWVIMYVIVFPIYTQLYFGVSRVLKSELGLALVGFALAFICGTLIDLPYILMSGLASKSLVVYLVSGFKVSLGNALCTFLATLYLYEPLAKQLKRQFKL